MRYQHFTYKFAVNICERRLKFLFFWVLLVVHPLASANEPSDCYPYCSQTEITKAKQFVTTEINKLSFQISRSESTINKLENDIAVVEFNIRRSQIGSKITSTSDQQSEYLQSPSADSQSKLVNMREELDIAQVQLIEAKSALGIRQDLLEKFENLTPSEVPKEIVTRTLSDRAITESVQVMNEGSDYEFDDDDNIKLLVGNYYALLIGVSDYSFEEVNDLAEPLRDANDLKEILTRDYRFEESNVALLANPTRNEVLDSLEALARKVKGNDNLLIFYAGHGYWDEEFQQGYWLPSDARKNSKSSWISNATIRDYIYGIKTKHTLLIADACFSGGMFKTRNAFSGEEKVIDHLFQLTSRKAITSGTLTEVPDNSVFMKYLLKNLETNQAEYLPAQDLFSTFKIAVLNNSVLDQIPQYGVVQGAGDEGGDFIFARR